MGFLGVYNTKWGVMVVQSRAIARCVSNQERFNLLFSVVLCFLLLLLMSLPAHAVVGADWISNRSDITVPQIDGLEMSSESLLSDS